MADTANSFLDDLLANVGRTPTAADLAADALGDALARAHARADRLRAARARAIATYSYGRRSDDITLDIIEADRAVAAAHAALNGA